MTGQEERFFVVLPDHETAAAAAGRLPPGHTRIMTHPSGRPWVVGRTGAEPVVSVEAGTARLVVVGHCSASRSELTALAARTTDPAQLDGPASRWAGSHHLIASVGGRTQIRGSASGLRRVFHGSLDGLAVAGDRADVLAALTGASLDRTVLALRLLGSLPHPLSDRPAWRGVAAVPPGSRLTLSPDGRRHRVDRWWHPPEAVRPLAEAAAPLRRALEEAVRVRTRDASTLTSDLSGGMDSTTMTVLAAREPVALTAFTVENDDSADDDVYWARLAAARLPGVKHIVFPQRDLPSFFSGLTDLAGPPDEPSTALLSAPRLRALRALAIGHGSRLHLDGLGGDQSLSGHPARYHDLLRSRPLTAARSLYAYRRLAGFPLADAARTLLDGDSYRRWLTAEAAALVRGRARRARDRAFDWGGDLRLPPWATPEARHLVTVALRETVRTAVPLAPARGAHADLLAIQDAGRQVRGFHQLTSTDDILSASPFLDDRVVEACLATRPQDRVTPWEFKPLAKAAMRGITPSEVLERRTKSDGTTIAAEGFAAHRRELAALWDSSRLAALGLADPGPLRALCERPYAPRSHEGAFATALACELWVRSAG
ncbi:asparagine synthase-related protein [Streptomyces mobaraensis]|uniref:asparagine synthase-related protein n=1 Tax=Streptomyces mobaraensis TaxID=35621 RepID=UPI0033EB6315